MPGFYFCNVYLCVIVECYDIHTEIIRLLGVDSTLPLCSGDQTQLSDLTANYFTLCDILPTPDIFQIYL